jgi:hypothetical protein
MMHVATTLAYGLILSVFYMAAILVAFRRHWAVPGFRFEFLVETLFVFTAIVSGLWQLVV